MHTERFGGVDYLIGDPRVIIDDLDFRTKVFVGDVIGKNFLRTRKTSEEYLAKLASGLIHRLLKGGRMDLVAVIVEGAFKAGYPIVGYKAKLYAYYMQALMEKGYTPEDPMRDTIDQQDRERKILREREEIKYLRSISPSPGQNRSVASPQLPRR